jgi:hypothetical protein
MVTFYLKVKNGDAKMVEAIAKAAGIEQYEIVDAATTEIKEPKNIIVAFGKICFRKSKEFANKAIELPPASKLSKKPENKKDREEAWAKLKSIASFEKEKKVRTDTSLEDYGQKGWEYAVVKLPSSKKLCVYTGDYPPQIQSDIFITKKEMLLLGDLKDMFGCETVEIE